MATVKTFAAGARVIVRGGSIYDGLTGVVESSSRDGRRVWISFDSMSLGPIRVDAVFVRPYRPSPVTCSPGDTHYHCPLGCHCQCGDKDLPGAPACKAVA